MAASAGDVSPPLARPPKQTFRAAMARGHTLAEDPSLRVELIRALALIRPHAHARFTSWGQWITVSILRGTPERAKTVHSRGRSTGS